MESSLFRYIWRHSRRQQIVVVALTLLSFPFLYASLEVPKQIVNRALGDPSLPRSLFGVSVGAEAFLVVLCLLFLALVIINGVLKVVVNTAKGAMAERMLRRLRFELCFRILRFPPSQFRRLSAGEIVTSVTAEVEPLGTFIGDAFAQPLFQIGTLTTILVFMFVQDWMLGLAALTLMPVQAIVVPRMQAVIQTLNRDRVLRMRKLSERIGETVSGVGEVRLHGIGGYLLADFSRRLGEIYTIRFRIHRQKFLVKFVLTFINQFTIFAFFLVGGLLVLDGKISLGALVAVVGAYRELSTPWKDLLDYWQQMEEATQKYIQIHEQFQPQHLRPADRVYPPPSAFPPLDGPMRATGLSWVDEDGLGSLTNVNFRAEPGEHVGIRGEDPGTLDRLARLFARLETPTFGRLALGDVDVWSVHDSVAGARIGYVGGDSYVFSATIAENVALGLRQARPTTAPPDWAVEAALAGNAMDDPDADWTNYAVAGVDGPEAFDAWWWTVIEAIGAEPALFRQGLDSIVDPTARPGFAERVLAARRLLSERLQRDGISDLVVPFDPDRFNPHVSIAENILFGVPADPTASAAALKAHSHLRAVMDAEGLTGPLTEVGLRLARNLADLLGGLPLGHPVRDQFDFVDDERLDAIDEVLVAVGTGGELSDETRTFLIALVGDLVLERHRLGLVDVALQDRIVAVRKAFHAAMPDDLRAAIETFDRDAYNPRLTVLGNVLFGRIDEGRSGAGERIDAAVSAVMADLDLRAELVRAVADQPAGVGGSRLSPATRLRLVLARSTIKRPDILVVNQSFSVLSVEDRRDLRDRLRALAPTMILIWIDRWIGEEDGFDAVWSLEGGRLLPPVGLRAETAPADTPSDTTAETGLAADLRFLRRVPLFASLDTGRLRLLAVTGQRVAFAAGAVVMREGDPADAAYVVIDGTLAVLAGRDARDPAKALATLGPNAVMGEIGLLCDVDRSATIVAITPVVALRLERQLFLDLLDQDGRLASAVLKVVAERLLSAEARART